MKKIFIVIMATLFVMQACKKIDYKIDPAYEKAEITGVEIYNEAMTRADQKSVINSADGIVNVTLKAGQDITGLKLAVTASSGASINPSMSVGLQDLTAPKVYTITSPNKTVVKEWTIKVGF